MWLRTGSVSSTQFSPGAQSDAPRHRARPFVAQSDAARHAMELTSLPKRLAPNGSTQQACPEPHSCADAQRCENSMVMLSLLTTSCPQGLPTGAQAALLAVYEREAAVDFANSVTQHSAARTSQTLVVEAQ